jgi:Tryptophan-associated transmembrane protein (Trp_oprn_chp)
VADEPHPRRRTFVPVVLLGVVAGVVAAVAGAQPWAAGAGATQQSGDPAYSSSLSAAVESGHVPAANALALVALACWGVVLVTRGRFRRYVAALGLLAALGTFVAVVVAFSSAPASVRSAYDELAISDPGVSRTGWFWVGAVAAVAGLVAWAAAVLLIRHWPEMGSRYDGPAGRPVDPGPAPAERSSHDLWKVMDEGRDPTS